MENPRHSEPVPTKAIGALSSLFLTLDTAQCAELLHCSTSTVEELAVKGQLPATKFGRGWTFVTKQILELLQVRGEAESEQRRAPAQKPTQVCLALHASKPVGRPRKKMTLPDEG